MDLGAPVPTDVHLFSTFVEHLVKGLLHPS